jgi:hypothetical protein
MKSATEDTGPSLADVLGAASSLQEAAFAVQEMLKKILALGLGIQPENIRDDMPLYDIGGMSSCVPSEKARSNLVISAVDSFKAVEIRNQVFRELKGDISVFEILSPKPLGQLSTLIASRSQLVAVELRATNDDD